MAMSVVYSNFCGMVVSETRGGVVSDYVSDPLGSTIGLMNSSGTMTDRWEYWPWGEVASRTGTSVTPLTFLGVLGYFKDVLDKLFYVRARHLRVDLARWLTSDPLWPSEAAYEYVENNPEVIADPSGLDYCSDYSTFVCVPNATSALVACLLAPGLLSALAAGLLVYCLMIIKDDQEAGLMCLLAVLVIVIIIVALAIKCLNQNNVDNYNCLLCACKCNSTLNTMEAKEYMMKCRNKPWQGASCPGM